MFKSQQDFFKINAGTMKTQRMLSNEDDSQAVDLRYSYKLLPPGSSNFLAKAWNQENGDDTLEKKNAPKLCYKKPYVEHLSLDEPETGALPTTFKKRGLGGDLIVDKNQIGEEVSFDFEPELEPQLEREGMGDEEEEPIPGDVVNPVLSNFKPELLEPEKEENPEAKAKSIARTERKREIKLKRASSRDDKAMAGAKTPKGGAGAGEEEGAKTPDPKHIKKGRGPGVPGMKRLLKKALSGDKKLIGDVQEAYDRMSANAKKKFEALGYTR